MKIAICLSGESRTWEKCVSSIRHFFEYDPSIEICYFGHTWSRNSWKVFDKVHWGGYVYEDLDKNELISKMNEYYNFAGLIVDDPYIQLGTNTQEIRKKEATPSETACNWVRPHTWSPMSYSAMMSNFQKQQFEINNNMKFDVVVKMRFDGCLNPNYRLGNYIKERFRDDVLYGESSLFVKEFMQQSINDVLYFGSSRVMDIIDTFYRVYHNGKFFQMVDANYYDGAMKLVGYGPLLYRWATLKNIYPFHVGRVDYQIVRQDSKIQNGITEYKTLKEESYKWGIIT